MKKTKIGIVGLTLVVARRNGDLPVRRNREAERREQTCRAKQDCPVYWGCAAALDYTHGAAPCLQKRKREIFGQTLTFKGENPQKGRIVLHTPYLRAEYGTYRAPQGVKNKKKRESMRKE